MEISSGRFQSCKEVDSAGRESRRCIQKGQPRYKATWYLTGHPAHGLCLLTCAMRWAVGGYMLADQQSHCHSASSALLLAESWPAAAASAHLCHLRCLWSSLLSQLQPGSHCLPGPQEWRGPPCHEKACWQTVLTALWRHACGVSTLLVNHCTILQWRQRPVEDKLVS